MKVKGKLIAIEGLDGSGSTTQTRLLVKWFQSERGYRFGAHATKEPTEDGLASGLIRLALTKRMQFDEKTLSLLFLADRLDHQRRTGNGVLALLSELHSVVVSDRYYLSSLAYQGLIPELGIDWLYEIHAKCLKPWMTFYIDVPPEECVKRIAFDRGFHFELYESQERLTQVRTKYFEAMQFLRLRGENIQVVNGLASVKDVAKVIQKKIEGSENSETTGLTMAQVFEKDDEFSEFGRHIFAAGLQITSVRNISNGRQMAIGETPTSKGSKNLFANFFSNGYVRTDGSTPFNGIISQILDEVKKRFPKIRLTKDPNSQQSLFD